MVMTVSEAPTQPQVSDCLCAHSDSPKRQRSQQLPALSSEDLSKYVHTKIHLILLYITFFLFLTYFTIEKHIDFLKLCV